MGGQLLTRWYLINKIEEVFGKDLIKFSSPGLASFFVFQSHAAMIMKVHKQEEDEVEDLVSRVAKKIVVETKLLKNTKSSYATNISLDDALNSGSPTLLNLLSKLSPKLQNTLPSALIGSIVNDIINSQSTDLQVSLGVLIRDSKALIKRLHEFHVTCSYNEVLRFKKSAAVASQDDITLTAISDKSDGMVQVVVDNFDADISSQNGKLSTHSLAMIVTQPCKNKKRQDRSSIPKVPWSEISKPVNYDVEVHRYNGPKQPTMTSKDAKRHILPLRVLAKQVNIIFKKFLLHKMSLLLGSFPATGS